MVYTMERALQFGPERVDPDIRKLSDMRDVVYDMDWLKTAPDMDLYFMYRDLAMSKNDRSIMLDHHLRFDITVIPPGKLGVEFVKIGRAHV